MVPHLVVTLQINCQQVLCLWGYLAVATSPLPHNGETMINLSQMSPIGLVGREMAYQTWIMGSTPI